MDARLHLLNLSLMASLTMTLTGCIERGRGDVVYYNCPVKPATSDGSYAPPSGGYGLQNADGKTIFERDVLPLLASTDTGKVYKCLVCHAAFSDPEPLKAPGRIDTLIERMSRPLGTQGAMPLNADQVTAADIAIFKAWETGGYLTEATATDPTIPPPTDGPTDLGTDPTATDPADTDPGIDVSKNDGYDTPSKSADAKPAGCP